MWFWHIDQPEIVKGTPRYARKNTAQTWRVRCACRVVFNSARWIGFEMPGFSIGHREELPTVGLPLVIGEARPTSNRVARQMGIARICPAIAAGFHERNNPASFGERSERGQFSIKRTAV